jgi:hypothetical protein
VVAFLDVFDQPWPFDEDAPTTIVALPEHAAHHTGRAHQGGARRARPMVDAHAGDPDPRRD